MNRLFPIATHLRQRLLDLLGKIGGIPAAAAYSRHRVTAGDHSCVAYAEIHDDETAVTAMAVLRRAVSWFAERDIRVERVLSDNGSACKSHARRDAYAGRFGTGFTDRMLDKLRRQLDGLTAVTPAAEVPREDARDAHWVRPELVGEVEHSETTPEGRLRHPVWRGLRFDKNPGEVRWEHTSP